MGRSKRRAARGAMRRLLKQIAMQILCGLAVVALSRPMSTAAQTVGPAQAKGEASTGQDANQDSSRDSNGESRAEDTTGGDSETVFPHTQTGRYWISGQANVILQGHGAFRAQYSGPNSLTNWAQDATTHLLTLYTGYELSQTTEVFADIEDATGNDIANTVGLAGFVNLDAVRVREGVPEKDDPYLAQLMLRQRSEERRDLH